MNDYKKELEELILAAMHESGSDIHLSTGRHPAIRVSGDLIYLVKREMVTNESARGYLDVLLNKAQLGKFMASQEIDFAYDYKGQMRLRGNAYFHRGSIGVALRLIPKVKTLSELNVKPHKAVMIGDNPIDIEAGKSAGTLTCAVTYGFF